MHPSISPTTVPFHSVKTSVSLTFYRTMMVTASQFNSPQLVHLLPRKVALPHFQQGTYPWKQNFSGVWTSEVLIIIVEWNFVWLWAIEDEEHFSDLESGVMNYIRFLKCGHIIFYPSHDNHMLRYRQMVDEKHTL